MAFNLSTQVASYWKKASANVLGVLGGLPETHGPDIDASGRFLSALEALREPIGTERVLDAGAGVGRAARKQAKLGKNQAKSKRKASEKQAKSKRKASEKQQKARENHGFRGVSWLSRWPKPCCYNRFQHVELLEPCGKLLKEARRLKVERFMCKALQRFTPQEVRPTK